MLLTLNLCQQTLWCWSSISTPLVHGGDIQPLTGKTTGKRGMRQMGSMEESESWRTRMKFPLGSNCGLKKPWNSKLCMVRVTTLNNTLNVEGYSSEPSELSLQKWMQEVENQLFDPVAWMWRPCSFFLSKLFFLGGFRIQCQLM